MDPKTFLREYCIKSLVCCFSGGKDSLVATHYLLNMPSVMHNPDIDKHVVIVDTTAMIPTAIPFVKDVCARFGWPLTVVKPEVDFFTRAKVWGPPTMRHRWCCYWLKLDPLFKFIRQLTPQRGVITGLRRDESEKRKKLKEVIYVKKSMSWNYIPIADWTERDVLKYMRVHDLPRPPHYRLGIKETCMCGAFTSKRELMILKAVFPELWEKFIELEKSIQGQRKDAAFFLRNKKVYAKDLAKQQNF